MDNKFLKKENKFLKKENKFLKEKNKFLKEDVNSSRLNIEEARLVFVEKLSNFMTRYLMGNPEKALEELKGISPDIHLFMSRSLLEEVGGEGFEKMYNRNKYRVSLVLKQVIRDIDNFIP